MDVSSKWNGVYKMKERRNARAFMEKFGVTSEQVDDLMKMEITNELTIDGDSFCLKQRIGDDQTTVNTVSSTLGKKDCFKTIDGLQLEGTITLDDKKDLRGKYDKGIEEYMRFTAENEVTDTVTYDGVSMDRVYQKM